MTGELQNIALKISGITPKIYVDRNFWGMILAGISLFFLIKYVIKTKELAEQARDANLRPVILRHGSLDNFDELKFIIKDSQRHNKILTFFVLKNIATSIKGYAIINNKKYELFFSDKVYDKYKLGSDKKQLGRITKDMEIYATIDEGNSLDMQQSNRIVIQYKDIENNSYYTIEDKNFDQKSYKGNP